ncbi:MAG: RrF2 family transcriptional regulator [Kineosporiaceae bacterium]
MHLQRDTRYAIEALLVLGEHEPGAFVDAREIGERAGLPLAYLHKILRKLASAGVVRSRRGTGYSLSRPLEATTMGEVLVAIEGAGVFDDRCIFWREVCSIEEPCALHFRWAALRPAFEGSLAATTLAEVAASRNALTPPSPGG